MNDDDLVTREEICAMRKRGRTSQIADENSGRFPQASMYRGRTPLWTGQQVKAARAIEVAELSAAADKMRAKLTSTMQRCTQARIRKKAANAVQTGQAGKAADAKAKRAAWQANQRAATARA